MIRKDSTSYPIPEEPSPNNGNSVDLVGRLWLLSPDLSTQEVETARGIIKEITSYSPRLLIRTLRFHRQISQRFQLRSPYFKFTSEEDGFSRTNNPLLNQKTGRVVETPDGTFAEKICIGRVNQLPAPLVAAVINDQIHAYIEQKTMGEFPRNDDKTLEDLIAIMIDGFDPSDVMIFFYLEQTGVPTETAKVKPIAGVRLIFGKSDKTVGQLNGAAEATIPTLSALKIDDQALAHYNRGLTDTPELRIVEASRLFSVVSPDFPQLTNPLHALAVCSYLPLAAQYYAQESGLPTPDFQIFNTHLPSLIDFTSKRFKSEVIAQDGQVQPTKEVLSTVLHYHYDGLKDDIYVGVMTMGTYLELALALLKKFRFPIPQQSKV